jgi:hypothetical protein
MSCQINTRPIQLQLFWTAVNPTLKAAGWDEIQAAIRAVDLMARQNEQGETNDAAKPSVKTNRTLF